MLSCIVVLVLATSCASSGGTLMVPDSTKRIAVISFTANEYTSPFGGVNILLDEFIWQVVDEVLMKTEETLGTKWNVVPTSEFVVNAEFQDLDSTELDVIVPTIANKRMLPFAENREQLVSAEIPIAKLTELAEITKVDYLVVIHTEWGVATGKMVPTSRAYTNTVVSVYNALGERLYHRRHEQLSEKILGAMTAVKVDENTIQQWVDAYMSGLDVMFQ